MKDDDKEVDASEVVKGWDPPPDEELFDETMRERVQERRRWIADDAAFRERCDQPELDPDDVEHARERAANFRQLAERLVELSASKSPQASDDLLSTAQNVFDETHQLVPSANLGDFFQTLCDLMTSSMEVERDCKALQRTEILKIVEGLAPARRGRPGIDGIYKTVFLKRLSQGVSLSHSKHEAKALIQAVDALDQAAGRTRIKHADPDTLVGKFVEWRRG